MPVVVGPGPPGARRRWPRRLGILAVVLVVLAGFGQFLRARYDVTGFVRATALDWASVHTRWLVASPEEVDRQVATATEAWSFPDDGPHGPAAGPLRVLAANPRYFADDSGRPVYLAGSHTWSDFQDNGHGHPPPPFDYERFLDFLQAHHHNFLRLWVWEQARGSVETSDDDYRFHPMGPFRRTGPGEALDGMPRWDLTRFDPAWFARLRERVAAAGARGIYVSVMLFDGWSVAAHKGASARGNPWLSHPMHRSNNVNGIDGDPNGDASGTEIHELVEPEILAIQEAYVRKVIETVGDLDNVLWEISNESHPGSAAWQYHMIDFIHGVEATTGKRHPVGMTAMYPDGRDEDLFASGADWVSPARYRNPHPADGSKVVIADTDHIFGIGGDRVWVWKAFTRGLNVAFMDGYDGAGYGVGGQGFDIDDPRWVSLRRNLGYTRAYAERMDLASVVPRPEHSSTGYCLMSASGTGRGEALVYAPESGDFIVDLSPIDGILDVEWFRPSTAARIHAGQVAGGARHVFEAPFEGDAVLYLHPPGGASP